MTVAKVAVHAYGSAHARVTEEQFKKLKKTLAGHAQLDNWDSLRGLQVKHEKE